MKGWEIYSKETDEKMWQDKYNEFATRPKSKLAFFLEANPVSGRSRFRSVGQIRAVKSFYPLFLSLTCFFPVSSLFKYRLSFLCLSVV